MNFAEITTEIVSERPPRPAKPGAIRWGLFINALIVFVIVALVVYLIATMFIKETEPDPTKECPFCFEANNPAATKCRACASAI